MKKAALLLTTLLLSAPAISQAPAEELSKQVGDYALLSIPTGASRFFFDGYAADAVFPIVDQQPYGGSIAFHCMRDHDLMLMILGVELEVTEGTVEIFDASGNKFDFSAPFVADTQQGRTVVTISTETRIAPMLRRMAMDVGKGENRSYRFRLTEDPTDEVAHIDVHFPTGAVIEHDLSGMYSACHVLSTRR